MNCACGHSVFDHAKRFIVTHVDPWRGEGGMFFAAVAGPSFTLSGGCLAFRKGESYRDCGCQRFTRPATLPESARALGQGEYLWGISRSVVKDIYAMTVQPTPEAWADWWKKYDRPPEGRMETM